MKSRVKKWGNGLALRIPKPFAAEVRLVENTLIELSVIEGKLIVQPLISSPLSLDELLQEVTEENLHDEWDTGPAVGREIR